ncbi:magnesium-translocating p-type atpase [Lasius niger]|uniref:P-type Ca(2+) transporter n=1 Tax=Lasius niger TaxID=67767 RepID=A0A0J7L6Q7_LASNI|nr:magnesium-translocating p-type atpase [Lasius niger]
MLLGEENDITELVPGDVIYLSSGDIIPADVRLINSHDLFINQSSLTGESLPIEKHADNREKTDNILELENICYTGTSVVSGSALAIVVATANETYFSSIGELMQEKRPDGSFLKGIKQVTQVLLIFMLIMVPLIYFIYIGVNSGIFFAVALAVALTPEMLPMIITTNLANGASKMTKQKVVVKRFDAIQSLGAIDILATDKTGTLTNDKIELINYLTIDKKNDPNEDEGIILVTKGSVEEVLEVSTKAYYEGKIVPLTTQLKRQITSYFQSINQKGERVLDTPKPSAPRMVKLLKKYGVNLKILTGDNEQVTRAICKMVNLKITGLVSGQEIENASESELKRIVEEANIFVKLSPLQKVKVLEILKSNNHSVGYIGDGINDAPVLYQSDVAISVNNAADIAKEASDIILLEKDLGVLEKGIVQGRTVFGNILKYIKITIASQFGNAFSMIIATISFGNLFLAMSPIQTLFQNLIYDFSQLTIAIDYVDDTFLAKPQR